jgi:hypothetical protein
VPTVNKSAAVSAPRSARDGRGHGSSLIWGISATGSITAWIPLMVFAFLFGLSMDYEVFILARMREEFDATGSTNTAVGDGTGRGHPPGRDRHPCAAGAGGRLALRAVELVAAPPGGSTAASRALAAAPGPPGGELRLSGEGLRHAGVRSRVGGVRILCGSRKL